MAMPGNIMRSIENYVHLGSKTHLVLNQRFKITYACGFKVAKFPFDKHECNFIFKLRVQQNNSILFTEDEPAILYTGPSTVHQFEVDNITSKTMHDYKSTNFVFTIYIHRVLLTDILPKSKNYFYKAHDCDS